MLCVVVPSVDVLKVATPLPSSVPVPIVVAPFLKATLPVGVPAPAPEATTVAVKVTDCPCTDGFVSLVSDVDVADGFTIWLTVFDVLALKFVSAPYSAEMMCVVVLNEAVLKVATPLPSSVPVPIVVTPSLNVTLPVGVPAPAPEGTTVAVTVTDCPCTDGFVSLVRDVDVAAGFTTWLTVFDVLVTKFVSAP
jgi:hypothetical protein